VNDRADDGVERAQLMHLQERRARVQPFQPHMGGIEAQFLVVRLAEEAGAVDAGPGRPDHLDGAGLRIGRVRRKLRRPAHGRQFDHCLHWLFPKMIVWRRRSRCSTYLCSLLCLIRLLNLRGCHA
jgi:hypothetical protein